MPKLLYSDRFNINDKIYVKIPKVGEVLADEDKYFDTVYTIIATPYDLMVQLDDNGIDFTKILSKLINKLIRILMLKKILFLI